MAATQSTITTAAASDNQDFRSSTRTATANLDVVTPLLNELQNLNLVKEEQLFWDHFIKNATSSEERIHLLKKFVVSQQYPQNERGIPHALRRCIWQALAQSSSACHTSLSYQQLLLDSLVIADEKIMNHDMKALHLSVNQHNAVMRVLKAYYVYDKTVGYSRGMAYVAHPLLSVMPENEAFSVFVRLMEVHQIRSLFLSSSTDGIEAHLRQFQQLLAQLCPDLNSHFTKLSIYPSMYASEWFLGLCATVVSDRQIIPRLYDIALLEGALETVYRVGLTLLLKNRSILLKLNEAKKITNYLASDKPYKAIYEHDLYGYQFISDILSLSSFVAKNLSSSSFYSLPKSQKVEGLKGQQMIPTTTSITSVNIKPESTVLEIASNSTVPESIDSGLSWKHVAVQTSVLPAGHSAQNTVTATSSNYYKQLQDMLSAMAQLKHENSNLVEENMALKMCELKSEAAQTKLAKRNAVLEKRVKKYKVKLANASMSNNIQNTTEESNTTAAMAAITSTAAGISTTSSESKQKHQYSSFVDTLRETGEFGALVAGALVPSLESPIKAAEKEEGAVNGGVMQRQHFSSTSEEEEEEEENDGEDGMNKTNSKKLESATTALQNVTSELVAVKLEHFELKQRFDSLVQQNQQLNGQIQSMQTSQTNLVQKIIYLESELEDVQTERDQIYGDQEEVHAMAMVAKKTAAELQMEKLALAKEVERLEANVKALEEEKRNFFMPRESFTEEVFAAHSILFGGAKKQQSIQQQKDITRRHTLQLGKSSNHIVENDEFKDKYIESELRCRELEKYLAETKVKLAEYESSLVVGSRCTSPRGSLQQHRRASSSIGGAYHNNSKRHSAASLSMLANRGSTPTSPSSSRAEDRRESTESYASSITSMTSLNSSNCNSKRSSVYSRIWNAFGSPTTPLIPAATMQSKHEVMCEEPQILEQQ
ncbi:rab-GTPase-TBC domain-containing protein [Mycotypha africana]|uniref:rab-GTPase-TBC domain-containing protein n=1 Tax=Mycotypha africana TaxID=64632 RepID=UPI0023006365|nr:rab-GTPase-TBC domain-containing protein [Mycotypha africana]KAI8968203.1 rab-GTPase-TBC domain-containing protein [Mycotypha africana]